jgi:hypothetical protein
MWVLSFKNWGVKLMVDGGGSGWIEQTDDGHPPQKKIGVFVCLVPLEVEQSWHSDFLFLARNFSWMHYAGAENCKGVEESY